MTKQILFIFKRLNLNLEDKAYVLTKVIYYLSVWILSKYIAFSII